jgi:hypothetical protein
MRSLIATLFYTARTSVPLELLKEKETRSLSKERRGLSELTENDKSPKGIYHKAKPAATRTQTT